MKINSKIYTGGVYCSVCGDSVQNLYALHELKDEGDGICGRCMCNHLVQNGYNVTSSKTIRNSELSDAVCPECKSKEMIVFIDNRNPLEIGTYFVKATCGHCGREYRVGLDTLDNALAEYDEDTGLLRIVPLDDCMIEVMWSHEHERLVGVVRDIPCRD